MDRFVIRIAEKKEREMRFKRLILVLIAGGLLACGGREKHAGTPAPPKPVPTHTAPPNASVASTTTSTGPTTTVTVHITGLVSFGEGTASTTGGLPSKMLYILNGTGFSGTGRHDPVVMARNRFQPTSDRAIIAEGGPVTDPYAFSRVDFKSDKLAFAEVSPSVLIYNEAPPKDVCPDDTESTSLYFFPHIRSIVPDSGDVADLDKDHIQPQPGSPIMAGWLDIAFGTLNAHFKDSIVWDFREDPTSYGSTHRQRIAQEAIWTFTIPSEQLTLNNVADPKNPEKIIQLTAIAGKIELTIANATKSGIQSIAASYVDLHEPADPHFAHVYDYFTAYLKDPTLPRYTPVAAGVCNGAKGTDFSSFPCDMYLAVNMDKPAKCTAGPHVGDVNCGPTGIP
jgi:hypothetical protein